MWQGTVTPSRRRTPGSIPGSPTTFLPSVKVSAPHSPGRAPGSNDPPDRSCAPGPVTIRISCQMPSKTDFCVKSLTRPGDAERLADLRAERRERHERAKSDMRRKPGIARPGGRSELKCGREHLSPQAGHGLAEAAKSPSGGRSGDARLAPGAGAWGVCTAQMARPLRPRSRHASTCR